MVGGGVACQEHAVLYIEQNKIYGIILHNNIITNLHLYQKVIVCLDGQVTILATHARMENDAILLFKNREWRKIVLCISFIIRKMTVIQILGPGLV